MRLSALPVLLLVLHTCSNMSMPSRDCVELVLGYTSSITPKGEACSSCIPTRSLFTYSRTGMHAAQHITPFALVPMLVVPYPCWENAQAEYIRHSTSSQALDPFVALAPCPSHAVRMCCHLQVTTRTPFDSDARLKRSRLALRLTDSMRRAATFGKDFLTDASCGLFWIRIARVTNGVNTFS